MTTNRMLPSDPEWLQEAWRLNGTKEIRGSRDNPIVVSFYEEVGHGWVKDDETAWCAAFVGAMLARAGLPHTNSLAARSYLQWGQNTTKPKRGDVVVFKRGNSSWQGHVAFYLGSTSKAVQVIGGNQSDAVNVKSYSKSTLLGYRTPVTALNSRTIKASMAGGGAAVVAGGAEIAGLLHDTSADLATTGNEWLVMAAAAIGLVATGIIVYARWDDWRQKGR